ncbi:hypothetical protein [Sebaldella sp. S0638]|uniref:hypothetical protein n=1 Tax=Sebaldella sp. S0638 TaxID=2957809 RepID=UPI00209F3AEE|nr:hypothetical protein [Sebaldella sp. S0638]MCP1226423.1 hypothetical protein [Sebaldella sp. S0638]
MKIPKLDREINCLINDSFSNLVFKNSDFSEIYSENFKDEQIDKMMNLLYKCFKAGFLSAYLYAE